jgi:hypothetical protein
VKVSEPHENAARVAGSSSSASATRRTSCASRRVMPQRLVGETDVAEARGSWTGLRKRGLS